MKIKFISFIVLIIYKKLIHCEIGDATNAISNAIVQTGIQDISLITDLQPTRIDALVKVLHNRTTLSFTIENFYKRERSRLSTLNVLVTERNESFSELFLQNFSVQRNFFLLIFLGDSDGGSMNVSKVFNEFWKLNIYNVNIIILSAKQCEDDIKMLTYMPFSLNGCSSSLPITINKFYCSNHSWMNSEIFPQKFRNLFDCPIKVSTFDYPPGIVFDHSDNDTRSLKGHEVELLNELSKMLNYKLIIEVRTEVAAWGQIFDNGSATGVLQSVMKSQVDIGIGSYYLTLTRAKFMSFIQYSSIDIILTVPRALQLTPLEKLFSPFTTAAWIVLLLPLCIGFGAISLMQTMKSELFEMRSCPHMNMLNIILNGSQHVVLRTTPARLLLISFVIFCLITRTLYQAGMFKFLQSDQRHADMQTIDELIEKNFDIYMYESFQELSKGLKIHQRRKFVEENKTIQFYQMQTLNPHFKGAAVGPLSEIIYANQINQKNFTFRVLPEIIFSLPVVMYLPKNHFLVAQIENCVGVLHSGGLIDYWRRQYLDDSYMKDMNVNSGPKKLTLDHLSGIFYIWAGGCCVSLICFIIELFHKRIQIIKRNLKLRKKIVNHKVNNYFNHEISKKKITINERKIQ